MKEFDRVIVEKEKYAKEGVHKGMIGTVIDSRIVNGQRLIGFDGEMLQSDEGVWYSTDIECAIKEEDLEWFQKPSRFF